MQHRSVLGVTRAPRRPFRPWTDNVSADDVAFASPSLKRPAAAPPSPRTLPPPPPPVPLAVLSVAPARAVVSGGKLRVRAKQQEELIAEMVDPAAADYCVLSGVHVHNWAPVFGSDEPNVEFVIPTACYSVVQGERLNHDLLEEPPVA